MVNGSGTLVSSLLQEGLVDELRLLVHPVVVGTGKHLFENGAEPLGMALEDVQRFGTGVLLLTYRLPLEDG
jgi:dihydrofolate reductase